MRRRVLAAIALTAAVVFLFCSVFTLVSAPLSFLWFVAILAAEWGHFGAIIAIFFALISWRLGKLGRVAAAVSFLAAILFAAPAVRAAIIARNLPARCTAAFGAAKVAEQPFSFLGLFSTVAKTEIEVQELVYASDVNRPLKLDLYRRRDTHDPQPLIVIIHGGSWKGGKRSVLPRLNFHLAREGYTVAAIDYRHAPKWPFPAAVDDTFRAIDYLQSRADELHLDLSRLALAGRSAGGQIALSAAYSGREPNVRAVIALYAPADLVLGYNEPSRPGVLDSRKVLVNYLGGSPSERPAAYAAGSPINSVDAATPPTLLVHGGLDPFVWPKQSRLLAAKLAAAGRPHLLLELPWATHGCDANPTGPSGQLSTYAIDRLLRSVFAAPND